MTKTADVLQEEIRARMKELEPLLEEQRELQQAADELTAIIKRSEPRGDAPEASREPAGSRASGPPRPKPTGRHPRQSKRKRVASLAELPARVLQTIRRNPGLTILQLAEELEVKANPLYPITQELVREMRLHKEGRRLFVAELPAGRASTEGH